MLSAPAQHKDVDDTARAVQAVQVQFRFFEIFVASLVSRLLPYQSNRLDRSDLAIKSIKNV